MRPTIITDKNYQKYALVPCVDCGKERYVRLLHGKPRNIRCLNCNSKIAARNISSKRGDSSPNWRGGHLLDDDGYILVYLDDSDEYAPMRNKKGYVREHRLSMARYLNRCLSNKEVVHHIDGDITNNSISNLKLFSETGEHSKYHNGLRDN